MRQWKIALSVAIVGALTAPFALGTYKAKLPTTRTWIQMTDELRRQATVLIQETNDCKNLAGNEPALESCRFTQKAFKDDGFYGIRPSMPLHLAFNAAVAVAAFGTIFALTFLVPALIRRYWRWLKA